MRYDFYHERREYKLLLIGDLLQKKKALNQWSVQPTRSTEKERRTVDNKHPSRTHIGDHHDGTLPHVPSRHDTNRLGDDLRQRTPRQSSMRVGHGTNHNVQSYKKDESSMFMTQPNELISPNTNFPKPSRTGAMLHRPNKSLNMSNARYNSFAPVHNVDE